MDETRGMLLWIAGAAGIILIYAAYKGTSPTHVLSGFTGTGATSGGGTGTGSGSGSGSQWGDSGGSASWGTDPGNSETPSPNPWQGYTMDANGNQVEIPAAYRYSPGSYIPPVSS